MRDFWKTAESIAPGKGWDLFSPVHLIWLAICVIVTVAASLAYRKCGQKGRSAFRWSISALLALNLIADQVFLIVTGQWNKFHLPLHLCYFGAFIIMAHTLFPKNDTAAAMTYALSLPGALLALLTPNWCILPIWNYSTLLSWTYHIMLVMYPIMLIAGGYFPAFAHLRKTIVPMLIVIAAIYGLNKLINTDFFFMNGATSVGWLHALYKRFGYLYLLIFPVLMTVLWTVQFLPFEIDKRRKRKRTAKTVTIDSV